MKAIEAARFGDPTVLTVVDLPDPTPGPGEIAIDVTYAAVGLIDVFLRQGLYRGFNAGAYIPSHPQEVRPAAEAALKAVAAGLGQTEIEVLPFDEAVTAHERMESRALNGRIVLTPNARA